MKMQGMWRSLAAGLWVSMAATALAQPAEEGGGPGGPGRGGPPGPARFLQRFDDNGDGQLSKEEVPSRLWQQLSRVDANNDEVVTKKEVATIHEAREKVRQGEDPRGKRPRVAEQRSARDEVKKPDAKPAQQPARAAHGRKAAGKRGRPHAEPPPKARRKVKRKIDKKLDQKVDRPNKKRNASRKRVAVKSQRDQRDWGRSPRRRPGRPPWAGRGRDKGGRPRAHFAGRAPGPGWKAEAWKDKDRDECFDLADVQAAVRRAVARHMRAQRGAHGPPPGGRRWSYQHRGREFHAGSAHWRGCPYCGRPCHRGRQAMRARPGHRGHGPRDGYGPGMRPPRPGRGPCPFAGRPAPRMRKKDSLGGPCAQAAGPPWARVDKPFAPGRRGPGRGRMGPPPRGPRQGPPGPPMKPGLDSPRRGGPGPRSAKPERGRVDRDRGPRGPQGPGPDRPPRHDPRD